MTYSSPSVVKVLFVAMSFVPFAVPFRVVSFRSVHVVILSAVHHAVPFTLDAILFGSEALSSSIRFQPNMYPFAFFLLTCSFQWGILWSPRLTCSNL